MSLIFLPVLLILGTLGAVLVILARKVPVIKKALKEDGKKTENKIEIKVTDVEEFSLAPRANVLAQPEEPVVKTKISRLFSFLAKFFVKLFRLTGKAISRSVKFLLRFFHRVPTAVKIPKFKKKEVFSVERIEKEKEETLVEEKVTTADIKPMAKHPLRFPEPLPKKKLRKEKLPETDSLDEFSKILPKRLVSKRFEPKREVQKVEKRPSTARRKERLNQIIDETVEVLENDPKLVSVPVEKNNDDSISQDKVTMKVGSEKSEKIYSNSIEMEMTEVDESKTRFVGSIKPKNQMIVEHVNEKEALTYAPLKNEPTFSLTPRPIESMIEDTLAEDSHQAISSMIAAGNYVQGESKLVDILSKNPRDTEAYRLLGIIYLKRGEISQAKEVFEEALRRDPDHPGLHGPLGFCLVSIGQYGKALQMYQRAHDMDETNIEYLEQLLAISSRMDRRPLVKVAAQKILALNPSHAEAKRVLDRMKVR